MVIADQLRERILDGVYRQGQQLSEANLAAQLEISRGPVREALQRLAQEGLLVSRRNRGVFVIELSAFDIAEIYAVRESVETAAARIIFELPTAERKQILDRLAVIVAKMPPLIAAGDWTGLAKLDLAFHTELVAAAKNGRLDRIYATLAAESRICMAQLENAYPRPGALVDEHQHLIDALAGDSWDDLAKAIHTHLSTAVDDLTSRMES
ncbi:MAG: GntR family transcriptional regulator [Rhodococcus sp.]|nr:GntR family transcriptional regulator [Rhodococcus sp. (in: high G+C Gram-positive bacteria)]